MYICDNYASYLSVRDVIRLSGTNILHYIIYSSFVSSSFGLRFGKNRSVHCQFVAETLQTL